LTIDCNLLGEDMPNFWAATPKEKGEMKRKGGMMVVMGMV